MDQKPRLLTLLDGLAIVLVGLGLLMAFTYAPLERVMGYVQKVFYFHISAAWVGMLGFLAAVVAGVVYLKTRKPVWDRVGLGAVEVSIVFFFIAILSGSIWARATWGTWWTWDPRLTSAAIVELVYAAYLMLRQGIEDPDRRARFGAIYSILAFVSVPITFISIRLMRTIHPVVIGAEKDALPPKMLATMFFSLFAFTIVFIDLFWRRYRLGELAGKVEQLREKIRE